MLLPVKSVALFDTDFKTDICRSLSLISAVVNICWWKMCPVDEYVRGCGGVHMLQCTEVDAGQPAEKLDSPSFKNKI